MRKLLIIGAASALGLALAAVALAGGQSSSRAAVETYTFQAKLVAGQEVPKPTGAKANAGGVFSAEWAPQGGQTSMTFHNLTGKAIAAHIHKAPKGKAGPVIVPLCGPCKTGQTGTAKITSAVENALEKGQTYVNVHTTKNANGEIRGQVKLVGK